MKKLITLDKIDNSNISLKNKSFLDPEYIYVPVDDNALFEDENAYISINKLVYNTKKANYYSSISGSINRLVAKKINNKNVNCIQIKNDYKEKKLVKKKKILDKNKEDLFQRLNDLDLCGLKNKISKDTKYIVLNCITDDPYIFNERSYLENYADNILETLDYISKILYVKNIIVVVKNVDSNNINSFISIMGSYPNFKLILMEDKYLMGQDYFLLKNLSLDKKNAIILKPSEIYSLYHAIFFDNRLVTKIITISGNALKNNFIVNTKLYVSVDEILNKFNIKLNDNMILIKNGVMNGLTINLNDELIDNNTEALIIMYKSQRTTTDCINCGKCYEMCPIKINPRVSLDNKIKNKNCISCGICNYVCPANINLLKYLKGDCND